MSVEKLLGAFLAGPAEGQDAEAVADLVLAALQQCAEPQQSLSTVISALLLPKPSESLPNGHGRLGVIPAGQASVSSSQGGLSKVHVEPSQAVHSLADQMEEVILERSVVERSAVHLREGEAAEPAGGADASSPQRVPGADAEAAASVAPLSPHSMTLKRAHSRLAHLCTLLSRLVPQTGQAQASEQSWQAGLLESVYKHLVEPDLLLSDPHAHKVFKFLQQCLSKLSRACDVTQALHMAAGRNSPTGHVNVWMPHPPVLPRPRWHALSWFG